MGHYKFIYNSKLGDVYSETIENTAKRTGGAKTQMIQMTRLIRSMLLKIWNYIVVIIFYSLILGYHEFIFSSAFEAGHFNDFFPHKVIFEVIT